MRGMLTIAAIAASILAMSGEAEAQRYYIRAKIPGLGPSTTPTPTPSTFKGTWYNTGEQSTGLCNNGTRRIDWVYGCRVDGNQDFSEKSCDPARKPDTLSHTQSCSSTCTALNSAGYVNGTGPGGSQTVSGTLAEMKAQAKAFCEGYSIRPDLERACSLRQDPESGQWRMTVASDFPPLKVLTEPNSWYGTCTTAG
jgi:hypothetical protein